MGSAITGASTSSRSTGTSSFIKKHHLEVADRWFARHGDATVFFTRLLPIVRTFISLPAGVAKMPFWRFTLFTFLGCLPWMFMLTFIGMQVGSRWEEWKDSLHYVDYAVAAIIVVAAVYSLREVAPGWRARDTGRWRIEPAADAPRVGSSRSELRSATPSRSAPCTGRPSCCRSPRRRT